jgi:hypothetical protein
MGPEPPVYRPFALLGLAATLAAGIPLGVWLLGWLYLGVAAVPAEWMLLHAHLSGILIWIAVACVGANLVAAIGNRSRGAEAAVAAARTGA